MNEKMQSAVSILWRAWSSCSQIEYLPEQVKPIDIANGYALQDALVEVSGDTVCGYKIAATSKAGQAHIGIDHPISGRLLGSRVLGDGATVSMDGNFMAVAEAEFVFEFATDIPVRDAPLSPQDVMTHVGALHLGIEVPSSRFKDFASVGAPCLIAECACAHWMVAGPTVEADWRDCDLADHPVKVFVDGICQAEGKGADALGDPRVALTWQVNNLMERGIAVQAGQIVTTGVCGRPVSIAAGNHVVAEFGDFGSVNVRLA